MSAAGLVAAGMAAAAIVAAPAAAQNAPPRLARVEVLDHLVLPLGLPAGQRLREVSGLAWDAAAGQLLTVSDRGVVVRWALDIEHRRLISASPVQAVSLAAGTRVNAESIEVLPAVRGPQPLPLRLIVADEKRHQILVADARGVATGTMPLPALLARATGRDANDGIEALAWHARHGVLAVRQRPSGADAAAGLHRLAAADGRSWTWPAAFAADGARSSVKAMHLLDARRVLVLEKLRDGARRQTLLREIDLEACGLSAPCEAPAVAIDRHLFPDDNFEGLACLDVDLCLIASDDGRRAEPRTVLALLWLARAAATGRATLP